MGNQPKIALSILALLAVVTGVSAIAATTPEPRSEILDLNSLVLEVIDRNAGLSARELKVKAMHEHVTSAGALDDPRISYAIAPLSIGDDIPSDFGNALRVRQVFQISQSIPWPGKLDLRTEEAEARVDVAQYSYEKLLLDLVSQSRSLWAEMWYADQALATNATHQQLLTELEGIVSTQYANGLGLQQDVLRTQMALVRLTHQQRVLEQERRRLQARLNGMLNQSADVVLGIPGDLPQEQALPDTAVLREWMLAEQPELLTLEAEASVADKRISLAEKEDFPDLQFNVGYTEIMNDSAQRLQVGVSFNLPLDLGGKRTSRKSAARFEYSSLLSDISQLRSRLRADLEQQLSRHDELSHNITLFETDLIPRAEQTFRAASANYEGGGGNFATLVEAQQQLLDLNLHLIRMRAEKIMTLTEIDRLSGGQLWPVEPEENER